MGGWEERVTRYVYKIYCLHYNTTLGVIAVVGGGGVMWSRRRRRTGPGPVPLRLFPKATAIPCDGHKGRARKSVLPWISPPGKRP